MNNLHIDVRDLNLFVFLDAVLTEGSNRAAAARLGVSQSAVSHALARLRHRLGDPLVVPSGGRMVPTPLAESLAPVLRAALEQLRGALHGARKFDPATARRTFWLSSADLAGMVVLPPLMQELTRLAASGVSVRVRGPGEGLEDALERGSLDLALGIFGNMPSAFRVQALFQERFVCLAREGHPVTKGRLTLGRYLEHGHISVAPMGGTGSLADEALARLGKSRQVMVAVPHFFLAVFMVARTDLLLLAPERMALLLAPAFRLKLLSPPLELAGFTVSQLWHERMQHDPAHAWLRKAVADVSQRSASTER
ncbi:LysR family transcriptional regulator [Corallococcus praedator]|uniref:LysR family transcriptional regulator n=1 Tax=Corallococcus praedator TaxID=2316724 RepID=A0ABX9QIK0_9BACT|nr:MULTISPECIES: LysR family transcriptional regulator [Corallococcus]RKH34311.1 LysR family transcriptional regulator [Corallococcus sp. CA031C]RKI09283.1 LysR family transcriptional regulator [Corallococcus praedator]